MADRALLSERCPASDRLACRIGQHRGYHDDVRGLKRGLDDGFARWLLRNSGSTADRVPQSGKLEIGLGVGKDDKAAERRKDHQYRSDTHAVSEPMVARAFTTLLDTVIDVKQNMTARQVAMDLGSGAIENLRERFRTRG